MREKTDKQLKREAKVKENRTFPVGHTLLLVLILLVQAGLIVWGVLYDPQPKDVIRQYDVTVQPREDGTLDITYAFEWTALDPKEPLTWVEIGMANEHYSVYQDSLSANIMTWERVDEDGYVAVKIPEEFKEGNAVVALKDAAGNILWSWHIWMTDAPAGQVYFNDAGTMMDRNLGATSVTPGELGTYGLLYQWGRKDPFLGASGLTSTTLAKSTITWPTYVESDPVTGTIEYAVANPTTYIAFNKMNYDWFYTDGAAADTTRWSVAAAPKTVYDPCPHGWRVPEGGSEGVWAKALGIKSSATYTFDSTNKGSQMGGVFGENENIWYPAAGNRDYSNGGLMRVGTAGVCQSVTLYKAGSHLTTVLYWVNNGRFYVYDSATRARAFSVRCIKE